VSPVRYELGSWIPEKTFFIVTAVKISNLKHDYLLYIFGYLVWMYIATFYKIYIYCKSSIILLN
jgi:hypothetical protein